MLVWHCPYEGLEYRCLILVGWTVRYHLSVDGQDWVRMEKPADLVVSLRCLQ